MRYVFRLSSSISSHPSLLYGVDCTIFLSKIAKSDSLVFQSMKKLRHFCRRHGDVWQPGLMSVILGMLPDTDSTR